MSNENIEKIPLFNDLLDEVLKDTNAFVQDITTSISLMPFAAIGTFALSVFTYWTYFHLIKLSFGLNSQYPYIPFQAPYQ